MRTGVKSAGVLEEVRRAGDSLPLDGDTPAGECPGIQGQSDKGDGKPPTVHHPGETKRAHPGKQQNLADQKNSP